jgi:hypothetical protein
MFTYRQSTGELTHPQLGRIAVGYAGADPDPSRKGEAGEGKNDPTKEAVRNTGPIPCGRYVIGDPVDSHGGFALPLTPAPGTDTHGRGGFMIHGDSISAPGTASLGCIIVGRVYRWAIRGSGDRDLQVVE